MSAIERRFQTMRGRMDDDAVARSKALTLPDRMPRVSRSNVLHPESIKPIARRLHEVLSDPTVPEIDRVRLEQPSAFFPLFQIEHPNARVGQTAEREARYAREGRKWILQGTNERHTKAR